MFSAVDTAFCVGGASNGIAKGLSSPKPARGQSKPLPLRSVENTNGVGEPAAKTNTTRTMNDLLVPNCNNNNPTAKGAMTIRTEPFSDHYTVISDIGRGKFAVVKRCQHQLTGLDYAAKFLRKRRKGKDCRHEVLQEISMLEVALSHPRLIDMVEVFETTHELIIVTEYAAGGELFKHMILEDRFEEKDVIRLMRQILDGLIFLHDRNIVHLDIKPQNILLTSDPPSGDIKLCDFGFARRVHSGEDILDIVGTPDYVAPEVLSYEPIRTSSDMWSVGVLVYVMLTGCSPFAAETKQETFLNISQVNLDFPDDLYEDISNEAVDFITCLLVREPTQRPTAHQCLAHPWLRSNETTDNVTPHLTTSSATNITISTTPVGSPLGCRRALAPSPEGAADSEPLKRYRCDAEKNGNDTGNTDNCNNGSKQQNVDDDKDKSRNRKEVHIVLESSKKMYELSSSSSSVSSLSMTPSPSSSGSSLSAMQSTSSSAASSPSPVPTTVTSTLTVKASKKLVVISDRSPRLAHKENVDKSSATECDTDSLGMLTDGQLVY